MNATAHKVDLIFDFLIPLNGLSKRKKAIRDIKNILFAGFKDSWKKKNQKFDFSFSFTERDFESLRFSYNNFGEKHEFYEKVLKIFSLFDDAYDREAVKKILDALDSKHATFQTTIGCEWKRNDPLPRFKIYFEEIHQELSQAERAALVGKIAMIIGCDFKVLKIKAHDNIGAICVDFFPRKKTGVKVYLMANTVDFAYLYEAFNAKKDTLALLHDFCATFSLEKSCFYYTARRFDEKGMISVKVYKIYEVAGIRDFSRSYKEIFLFLKQFSMKKEVRKFKEILSFALKNNIVFYPVISSMDVTVSGAIKYDLYLSIYDNLSA